MKQMNVFVYRNLHKNCYSIKDTKLRRVILHLKEAFILNASFKVSESGRLRVIKEKRKNVHAGISGELISKEEFETLKISMKEIGKITYNPYANSSFIIGINNENFPIKEAELVFLREKGVFAYGKQYSN